jgi:hypothetical protein
VQGNGGGSPVNKCCQSRRPPLPPPLLPPRLPARLVTKLSLIFKRHADRHAQPEKRHTGVIAVSQLPRSHREHNCAFGPRVVNGRLEHTAG